MMDFLSRVLGKDASTSKNIAKERLRLVLVHDRATVSPQVLDALKGDLIKVISNYMEIDEAGLDVYLDKEDENCALVANIPVVKMKRAL